MYGFSVQVEVKTIEQNKRIVVEWPYTVHKRQLNGFLLLTETMRRMSV